MAEIKIGRIIMGAVQTNTYFLYREGSPEVVYIDPADRGDYLYEKLKEKGFTVSAILLTHGHFDHIWGVEGLKEKSGAEVYASEDEEKLLSDTKLNCSKGAGRPCSVKADHLLKDEEEITLAGIGIRALKTPGHTEGSMCFYVEEAGILIAGDTLFCESVGRTDLPTGSMSELVRSVREKLLVLPPDTKVYPGHGEATTIAYEKEYNPFL